jgi:hypothetical protein
MVPSDPAARDGQRVDEWSIVRFDGQRETIAMRLESSTAFERAALVMPVPARTAFALGDEPAFARVAALTRPRVEQRERYRLFAESGDDGEGGGAPRATGEGAVEVVDAQQLGPLGVVTLRGDDAGVVTTWLRDHGFPVPRGLEPIAQEYLDRGWLLVAVRLRGRAGGEVRRLQPLVLRFPSDEVVYPLRMSELAAGPTRARVDVVAPEPLALRGGWPADDVDDPGDTARGGRLFGGPLPGGRYLSSFRFAIDRDGFDDPRFVAAERRDFRQVRYVYEDVALWPYALGALALIVAVAAGARRALRRRHADNP